MEEYRDGEPVDYYLTGKKDVFEGIQTIQLYRDLVLFYSLANDLNLDLEKYLDGSRKILPIREGFQINKLIESEDSIVPEHIRRLNRLVYSLITGKETLKVSDKTFR